METKNSEFIREKIKEKPINKKKLWNKLVVSGLCGIVFAMAFCLVLLLAAPLLKEKLTVAEKEAEETQTNLPMDETETEEENPVVPEEGNVTEDFWTITGKPIYVRTVEGRTRNMFGRSAAYPPVRFRRGLFLYSQKIALFRVIFHVPS